MRGVRCADCAEYKSEWCEKVIDSPHPDLVRDCQYYHEKDKDVIKVIRCKDCKRNADNGGVYDDGMTRCPIQEHYALLQDGYCHLAERREDG